MHTREFKITTFESFKVTNWIHCIRSTKYYRNITIFFYRMTNFNFKISLSVNLSFFHFPFFVYRTYASCFPNSTRRLDWNVTSVIFLLWINNNVLKIFDSWYCTISISFCFRRVYSAIIYLWQFGNKWCEWYSSHRA